MVSRPMSGSFQCIRLILPGCEPATPASASREDTALTSTGAFDILLFS